MGPEIIAKANDECEQLVELIYELFGEFEGIDVRDVDARQRIADLADDVHLKLHVIIRMFRFSDTPGTHLHTQNVIPLL